MAGKRKGHPSTKNREKRRAAHAETFKEGFTLGYNAGYRQARADLNKNESCSKICFCGGIIGLGTVTINTLTGGHKKNPPACSKCGRQYPKREG